MEAADVDACVTQPAPERAAGPEGAEAVVQHAHVPPGARARRQRLAEAPTGGVVANDVVLEMDPPLGGRDHVQHRGERGRAVGVVRQRVAGDRPDAGGAVHGLREASEGEGPGVERAHPAGRAAAPSDNVSSTGRRAAITNAMCSSSGTPSSSAPWRTSSRFTPRANALSLSFFLTEGTSRSARLFDGRTSAQATKKPHSSSTANSVWARRESRGTPE